MTGESAHHPGSTENSLTQRSLSSSAWSISANLIAVALRLLRAILLARWLPIEVFGVYALASAVVGLSALMTDLGLGEAFLHRAPESENEDLAAETHLTLKALLVSAWVLIVSGVAVLACHGELLLSMLLLTGTTALQQLSQTPRAILTRRVRHQRLAAIQVVTAVCTTAAALGLALNGASLWALLSVDLLAAVIAVTGLYLWRPIWRPRLGWSRPRVRYFLTFGAQSFTATVLQEATDRLDDLWTGVFLGSTALGLYSRAYGLATYPKMFISRPVSAVLGGTYAELKGDRDRLSQAFFLANAILLRLSCPLAAALALLAPELVGWLLGDRWLPMVPAFRVLTVFTLLDPLRFSLAGLFPAVGRPDLAIRARAGQLVTLGIGLLTLGPAYGITGVALSVATATLFAFVSMVLMSRRFIGFSLKRLLLAPVAGACLGAAVAVGLDSVISAPVWAAALLELGTLAFVYMSCLLIFEHKELKGLLSLLEKRWS